MEIEPEEKKFVPRNSNFVIVARGTRSKLEELQDSVLQLAHKNGVSITYTTISPRRLWVSKGHRVSAGEVVRDG
jgi:lysophospholipid acyltransferase (LPLAT)-like uncharacterized protein